MITSGDLFNLLGEDSKRRFARPTRQLPYVRSDGQPTETNKDSEKVQNHLIETMEKLNDRLQKVEQERKNLDLGYLNNEQVMAMLNISKRTLQNWRNDKKIGFSNVNGRIYYRRSDIELMLEQNYKRADNK